MISSKSVWAIQRRLAIIFRCGGVVRLKECRGLNPNRSSSKPENVFMERRAAPRKPVLLSGVITFADSTVNCLICDMNISGAAIEITNPQYP
jgi:hypothetical protein